MTERLHFHFSLSCIEEGNGNPLQCSCLENPRDGGAWWAAVYGVAQSRTRLKQLSNLAAEPINNVVIVSGGQWRDSAIHIQYTDALMFLQPYSKLNSWLISQSLIFILLCFILVDAIIFLPVWAVFWIIWEDTMHLWRSLKVEGEGRRSSSLNSLLLAVKSKEFMSQGIWAASKIWKRRGKILPQNL